MTGIFGYLAEVTPYLRDTWAADDAEVLLDDIPAAVHGPFGSERVRFETQAAWIRWSIDGWIAPGSCKSFADACISAKELIADHGEPNSAEELLITLAKVVWSRSESFAERRRAIGPEDREDLIGTDVRPHCWICGRSFTEPAIQDFLSSSKPHIDRPRYVDRFTPRGRASTDLNIVVDHVMPISTSGRHLNNLRLACGWCNGAKSDAETIYDTGANYSLTAHDGQFFIPKPLWCAKALASARGCQVRGCESSTHDGPLFISLVSQKGLATPPNLLVTCSKHDPMRNQRYVRR